MNNVQKTLISCTSDYHNNIAKGYHIKKDDELQLQLRNQKLASENSKLVNLTSNLTKELEVAKNTIKEKDRELFALKFCVERQQNASPNQSQNTVLPQSIAQKSGGQPKDGTILEMIKNFDVVVQNYHDIIERKDKEIQTLKASLDQTNQKRLQRKRPSTSDVECFVNKIAKFKENHIQTNNILTARNEKLEKLVEDLTNTLDKYSHEIKTLTNQLEYKAVQSSHLTYKLFRKKEKENERLRQFISEIGSNNLGLQAVQDDLKCVRESFDKIKNVIIDKIDIKTDSKSGISHLDKYYVDALDLNYSKKYSKIPETIQSFLCKDSPTQFQNDNQKQNSDNNRYQREASKTLPVGNFILNTNDQNHCVENVDRMTQLPQRPWLSVDNPLSITPVCHIKIMTYNVLCDKLATPQAFGYCPPWALKWEYRKTLILSDLRMHQADIICLQEVETHHFNNFFLPELRQNGYDGIFLPKSRGKTLPSHKKMYVDGCAIFYKSDKFSCVQEYYMEFNHLFKAIAVGPSNVLNRVMSKDHIGLAALLVTRERAWVNGVPKHVNQMVLVCTTHIYSNPDFCDVKLIQVMMMMHTLRSIIDQLESTLQTTVPLLLGGDFNSLPGSGVYEFLTSGQISDDHPDFKGYPYKAALQNISNLHKSPKEFIHSFNLSSAYGKEDMPFTNYTANFEGVIDYIFYSKGHMKVLNLLGPLSSEWLKENNVVGAPHPLIASDHFPIMALMEMLPVESSR